MALSPISDLILSKVLSHYPLGNTRVLDVLTTSKRNDNFLVEDASLSRYVLRRYRRNNQEDRVRFQLDFQEHLEDSGFPTSKIIKTISDDMVVVKDGSPWALFTFIEGKEYDFSRIQQVTEAARRLAQFHTVAESFQCPEVPIDINWRHDWWTETEREIDALGEFFAGLGVEHELAYLREYVAELVDEYPLERKASLRLAWLHGDYHGRNMVFVGDEMRGLFDFDDVYRGFRIADVARALFMFGRQYRGSNTIRPDIARPFLEEYARNTGLGQEELATLPAFAVIDGIPSAPYFTILQKEGEDPVSYLRSFVDTMRTRRSEMKRLEPLFEGYSV